MPLGARRELGDAPLEEKDDVGVRLFPPEATKNEKPLPTKS